MKREVKIVKVIALATMLVLVLNMMGGCAVGANVEASSNLMEGINVNSELTQKEMEASLADAEISEAVNKFGVSLFKEGVKENGGENILISPISVLYAMAMCANGAEGMTMTELMTTFIMGDFHDGCDCILEDWQENLNKYLASYLNATENYAGDPERPAELHIANSIWMKDDEKFHVEKDFLETNGKFYNAGLFKAAFNEQTRKNINAWIEENTKGLIKDMLKQINADSVMYLVNALGFEAEWADVYFDYNLTEDEVFHGEAGDSKVTLMHSTEYSYLKDELATGFIKYYAGYDYAFVGLLPNEGVSVDEYVASLTGQGIYEMLNNISDEQVITAIPQFEDESALSLVDTFKALGLKDSFDVDAANFSRLGTYEDNNIYIGNILHNTFIKVDQKGTKAGAATIVEMACGSAYNPEPPKEVILDRPFIYMIIDANQNIPLFIGVERNIK